VDATIFLPTTSSQGLAVPLRLRAVTVEDKTLTLSVEPMTNLETAQLLQRLSQPQEVQTARSD
jgi:hypothetical protein